MAMSSFFSLFPFLRPTVGTIKFISTCGGFRLGYCCYSSGSKHQNLQLLPSRLRPMVCYRLRLGGYLFYFYCHRGLGRWFATARDFGWLSLRLQILPSRLRPMVLQPPASWVETLLSYYCHCSLGRWFSVAAACSRIKFSSVLTLTVASYADWDGYCFIDAVRALFSDPLITGPGSSA